MSVCHAKVLDLERFVWQVYSSIIIILSEAFETHSHYFHFHMELIGVSIFIIKSAEVLIVGAF